jgi:hypothetical protein
VGVIESVLDYRSLSIRDLLEAREQYHWHLTNRRNVVGTAIGLYLIRADDPWPSADDPTPERRGPDAPAKTLAGSEVRPYSWPCVIAFVEEWVKESDFTGEGGPSPQDLLPETLYLPDGRTIPVCVVAVEPGEPAPNRFATTPWPETQAGGGFGLVVRAQEVERRASVGCLVSDGHTLYALTNRHVCGEPGERISAQTRSGTVEIGTASKKQMTRRRFTTVYPTFAGDNTYLNLDAGLVEVDDANDWTASFYGLGDAVELADLNEANIGLQLIDKPVVAHGAASGNLHGTIKALFYRYKSLGGWDYVADLLIAPAAPGSSTQPGDSGTVWHVVLEDQEGHGRLYPVAVEWGAQTFVDGDKSSNFTLATNLSSICKLLDVELVLEHNTAARPFWGATGHYSIAATAVAGVRERRLGPFLRANADTISFDRGTLAPGHVDDALHQVGKAGLVPLADVPDVIWKKTPWTVKGGRDTSQGKGPEHPTHYCDIDEPGPDGKTLRDLCVKDPAKVDVATWRAFYDAAGDTASESRGCLPFRVWQFYDAMVGFVTAGDYAGYLCTAGLVAHYVGDACQPLHGSILADGDPAVTTTHITKKGKPVEIKRGHGVHTAYETKMIDRHAAELFPAIDKALGRRGPSLPAITTGHDAAVAIVALMDRTARTLPPRTLLETYVSLGGGASQATLDGLWAAFSTETAKIMADGIRVLEHVWVEAWRNGGGATAPAGALGAIDLKEIKKRYRNTGFVPSLDLDDIGAVLR